jgi:hypothetical protein
MGFDLRSESGAETRYSGSAWAMLLNLGQAYGWQPAGTSAPPEIEAAEWEPDVYDTNDGQTVTRQDAANLAEALESLLADPGQGAKQVALSRDLDRLVHKQMVQILGEAKVGPYMEDPNPLVIPDDTMREFIEFLRQGSFRIE